MGDIVTERLQDSFSDLLDYGFTATMEERLDEVAQGALSWTDLSMSSTPTSVASSRRLPTTARWDAAQ